MQAYFKENGKLIFRPGATQVENFLIAAIPGTIVWGGIGALTGSWAFAILVPVLFLAVIYAALFHRSPLRFSVEVSESGITLLAFGKPVSSIPISQIHAVGMMQPEVGSRLCNQNGVYLSKDFVVSLEQLKKETRIVLPLLSGSDHENPDMLPGRWIHLGDFETSEAQNIVSEIKLFLNTSGKEEGA